MERLGLHGKSILPFISGFLCNIIGVVGARVIDSSAQRRTTIVTSLAIPCMSCWGVILLVAAIFLESKPYGITLPSQWHRFTVLVSGSVSGMSDTFFEI
jgi:Fe2+ transport system protein B